MPDILQYSFMVRALIAGAIVGVTIPLLGNFLVARRYALVADSLSHVSLAGVGLGLVAGVAPIAIAIPITVVGALLLEWLRQSRRLSGDVSLAILMSSGLALAIVLANLAQGASANFSNYLFGSITTTSDADVLTLAVFAAAIIFVVIRNYSALLHMVFDEDSARISGYKVSLLNYTLVAMTAIIVVLSLRIVGGLLISALLVMPVVTAGQFARSFLQSMVLAVCAALAAVLVGLVVAFYAGIAAGGAIVLTALAILVVSMLLKK